MQNEMAKDDAGRMSAVPNEMRKDDAGKMPALQVPKPTPPPKNPQMVVTDLQRAKLLRAVYSDQQLYELMVDFWENHFSIFANKDSDRYLLTGFDRETIRPFALGRFRDLLGATAHSPAAVSITAIRALRCACSRRILTKPSTRRSSHARSAQRYACAASCSNTSDQP